MFTVVSEPMEVEEKTPVEAPVVAVVDLPEEVKPRPLEKLISESPCFESPIPESLTGVHFSVLSSALGCTIVPTFLEKLQLFSNWTFYS